MAWLQKRPQVSDPQSFYTLGLNKIILLVGLGNPGPDYELTRHNVGFICLDSFVSKMEEMSEWVNKKNMKCLVSTGRISEAQVIAIKPTTFMNLSGQAVAKINNFYKINPANMVVVHDELDIDFGQIRLRRGGSSGGHKGIESITSSLGEDFTRVRVGIGPKQPAKISSETFVLKQFSSEEKQQLPNLTQEVNAILSEYIFSGQLPHDTRSFLI